MRSETGVPRQQANTTEATRTAAARALIQLADTEANYRLWNVTTKAGEAYAERLDGETATSIELLDLTGQRHTVQHSSRAGLESSNQSIIPTGFKSLGTNDLTALL